MRIYMIKITMDDGKKGRVYGSYSDGFDAVIAAMETYPNALRISAWRLNELL